MPVWVIAPGLMPRPSARESRSDRLDCRKLAQYAAAGLLRPTGIPTPEEEAERQVVRPREHRVRKRRRIKQQIKSFMLQHGIVPPASPWRGYWTKPWIHYLAQVQLGADLRFCLDGCLEELSALSDQLKRVETRLQRIVDGKGDKPGIIF